MCTPNSTLTPPEPKTDRAVLYSRRGGQSLWVSVLGIWVWARCGGRGRSGGRVKVRWPSPLFLLPLEESIGPEEGRARVCVHSLWFIDIDFVYGIRRIDWTQNFERLFTDRE